MLSISSSGSSPIALVRTEKKYNLFPKLLSDDRTESNDTLDPWIVEAQRIFKKFETPDDQYEIGLEYYFGDRKVTRCDVKALFWLNKSAQTGNLDALNLVGLFYLNGNYPVKQSNEKAFECFQKAADKGHKEALYILGSCYAHGVGKYKNVEKAKEYLERASRQEDEGARDLLFHLKQTHPRLRRRR